MKANHFFHPISTLLAICLLLTSFVSNAQNDRQTEQVSPTITYCEDAISDIMLGLEKRANSTCRTAITTVPCRDKRSGISVNMTLMAQPDQKICPRAVRVETSLTDAPASRGIGTTDAFNVEVLQEPCNDRAAVTLTAFIPGHDLTDKRKVFDFEWMTDGEVFDRDKEVYCVKQEKITLKVTNIETGQVAVKSITLQTGQSGDSRDYKMFGFEKTPCFGKCPTYKVAISKEGKATWKGTSNVDKIGEWEATVDARQLQALKDAALSANFFDLENKYPREHEVADASRTITYFRTGDTEKTVVHTLEGPKNLVQFEQALEKTITNLRWKRVQAVDTK